MKNAGTYSCLLGLSGDGWIWVQNILPRWRPADVREVDAASTHTLCGFAHLPVHPLLLTNQTSGPLRSVADRESGLPREWTRRCERRCRLQRL
eukprot:1516545-Pyramimonas_sp.AAC.1